MKEIKMYIPSFLIKPRTDFTLPYRPPSKVLSDIKKSLVSFMGENDSPLEYSFKRVKDSGYLPSIKDDYFRRTAIADERNIAKRANRRAISPSPGMRVLKIQPENQRLITQEYVAEPNLSPQEELVLWKLRALPYYSQVKESRDPFTGEPTPPQRGIKQDFTYEYALYKNRIAWWPVRRSINPRRLDRVKSTSELPRLRQVSAGQILNLDGGSSERYTPISRQPKTYTHTETTSGVKSSFGVTRRGIVELMKLIYPEKCFEGLNENTRVLDIGCGEGEFVEDLREQLEVPAEGCDPSEFLPEEDYFKCKRFQDADYPPNTFDRLFSSVSIFHYPNSEHDRLNDLKKSAEIMKLGATFNIGVYKEFARGASPFEQLFRLLSQTPGLIITDINVPFSFVQLAKIASHDQKPSLNDLSELEKKEVKLLETQLNQKEHGTKIKLPFPIMENDKRLAYLASTQLGLVLTQGIKDTDPSCIEIKKIKPLIQYEV